MGRTGGEAVRRWLVDGRFQRPANRVIEYPVSSWVDLTCCDWWAMLSATREIVMTLIGNSLDKETIGRWIHPSFH